MAIEPAGVSLEAQGFSDYVRKLKEIEQKQRDVFETEFRETGKSFDEVTRAARQYEKELEDVAKAERKAAKEAENLARAQVRAAREARVEQERLAVAQRAARASAQQAALQLGTAAINSVKQIGQAVIETAKLAARFEGQKIGLDNLAASFGQSGSAIKDSIQKASKGTISGIDAIQAANTALLFGVAETPEQFEALTKSALTLGRTLGLTGVQSIEQFTTALGRQSLLILDNFGISAKQVSAEIDRLAKADFGKARSQLDAAEKSATFMKAALNIAATASAVIGEEAGKAQAAFDGLEASTKDLQVTFGTLVGPLGTGIANALSQAAKTAQQFFAFLGAGFVGVGTIATGVFGNIVNFFKGEATRSIDDILDEAGIAAISRFKAIASTISGVSFDEDTLVKPFEDQAEAIGLSENALKAYQSALKQAEQLQLSFSRAAEDTALKLLRSNEDIARKQAQSVGKLQQKQAKDRDKLLKSQAKQFDKFEADRRKTIAKAEGDIQKARKEASDKRKSDQKKLQSELRQAQEKFNLSQLQSERRFSLSERRLRAEGDILAIQRLREDRELERQEDKENFDVSQKDRVKSAEETQKEQAKDLNKQINDLKSNLENKRAKLLASFNKQLSDQVKAQAESQAEAKEAQQVAFAEQAAERAIQLTREEEDRKISQGRQLEDLGRSLASQKDVTEEGATAIAGELEKVFGLEGTADNIITGFTAKTENEFTELFKNLEKIVSEAEIEPKPLIEMGTPRGASVSRIGGIQEFQEGGIVPGPVGSPQIIQAHGGETVLPAQQRSFVMAAPVIPSQSLDVSMSGGFNITGDGQGNDEILQAASREMTENFKIAVRRLARRN